MEPAIYIDLNKACRNVDQSKLSMLGPYARVLYEIFYWGCEMQRDDKMEMGYNLTSKHDQYGYFGKCFVTFRGVKMANE